MTHLEQALASVLVSIEMARREGNPLVLAALLQRKGAICAALCAPEQAWLAPEAKAAQDTQAGQGKAYAPSLAAACA
jgi:uncharacterized protein (DUF2141 family)